MATKSTKSSGTQHNARGATQGNTLVGPKSGLPIDEVVDSNGTRRLAVDANFVAQNVQANVNLDSDEDEVAVEDPDTGAHIRVELDGSINVNSEIDAADGDNIAIQDSAGDELNINPDGSINVNVVTSNIGTFRSPYAEVTSVASSVLTTIQTYTVPALVNAFLQKIEVSGTNIAEYRVEVNAVIKAKKRTYFGSSLNTEFIFADTGAGLPLVPGDIVTIKVIHIRPMVGDFNSRVQAVEV